MWLVDSPEARRAFDLANQRIDDMISRLSGPDASAGGGKSKGLQVEEPRVDQYFCAGPMCGPKAATRDGCAEMEVKILRGISPKGSESWEKLEVVDLSEYERLPWVSLLKTRMRCKVSRAVRGTRLEGLKALEMTQVQAVDDCLYPAALGGMQKLKRESYLTVAVEGSPEAIGIAVAELRLEVLAPHALPNPEGQGLGLYRLNVSYPRFISIAADLRSPLIQAPMLLAPPVAYAVAPPISPPPYVAYAAAPPSAATAKGSLLAVPQPLFSPASSGGGSSRSNGGGGGGGGGGSGSRPPRQTPVAAPEEAHLDIVQFSAPIYFVEESEGHLILEVIRLGSMKGKIKVKYRTEDASAKSGRRYKGAAGQVVFKDGEHTKQIKVEVLEDDMWCTTLEFKIHLESPDNCELGLYLHIARVKIIDNDLFPSSRFKKEMQGGEEGIEHINGPALFKEYVQLVYKAEGIGWRTTSIILLDQMQNFYLYFTLYVNVYLVDVLFNTSSHESEGRLFVPGNRKATAIAIGVMYIVPMLFLHLWDYKKVKLDLGGLVREFLQTNLFRKYLNYSEQSRMMVQSSVMQVAIIQDTVELTEGYVATLNMIQMVGKLIILVYFILLENPAALGPIVAMPSMMIVFVYKRSAILVEACEHAAKRTASVIEVVHEACDKYRLIADYFQRPQICDHFQRATIELTEAQIPAELIRTNNDYFPKWLGPVFIGLYIAREAGEVLSVPPTISLGTFLATVKIFGELSEQFSEGYEELMKVSGAIGPLKKLTMFFNMPTDVMLWKTINRKRREFTKVARAEAFSTAPEDMPVGTFKSDLIQLKVQGLSFHYPGSGPLLQNINCAIEQGKIVAVVGEHGCGKTTFLRLLGHTIFPDEGMIFVPTHLRLLHVEQKPELLGLSAWQNLTFGRPHADPKRVKEILIRLKMEKTLDFLEKELQTMWAHHEHRRLSVQSNGQPHHGGPHGHGSIPAAVKAYFENLGKEGAGDGDDAGEGDLGAEGADGDEASNGAASDGEGSCSTGKSATSKIGESDSEAGSEPPEYRNASWQETLASAERAKIHLARALIVNPEVLVLQRPLIHYDDREAPVVLEVITDFVNKRGICLPEASINRRRPRTLFFSPSTQAQAKKADVVWRLNKGKGQVSVCKAEDLTSYDITGGTKLPLSQRTSASTSSK